MMEDREQVANREHDYDGGSFVDEGPWETTDTVMPARGRAFCSQTQRPFDRTSTKPLCFDCNFARRPTKRFLRQKDGPSSR